jgi:hypothetical protein
MKTKTTFSLFIIESLLFADECENRFEGRILRDIFRLSGHKVDYLYIRTRKELKAALEAFHESRRRYLHLSCHGNETALRLTLDGVTFKGFASDVGSNFLKGRRLFVSACAAANSKLADALSSSGCLSIIGPQDKIRFDDAVMIWSSFYYLLFSDFRTDVQP